MIIRLIAVDPRPRLGHSDVLVYQVPERSREYELLTELLESAGIEWTSLGPTQVSDRKSGSKTKTKT